MYHTFTSQSIFKIKIIFTKIRHTVLIPQTHSGWTEYWSAFKNVGEISIPWLEEERKKNIPKIITKHLVFPQKSIVQKKLTIWNF